MLSVLIATRDCPMELAACLAGAAATFDELKLSAPQLEYVFVDDCSQPRHGIVPMLQAFRNRTSAGVRILRFHEHQHYTHALAHGLSAARGERVLFLSHDMVLTPACVRTLHAVAEHDSRHGIVRPISQHLDCFEQVALAPPRALRNWEEIRDFSAQVAHERGMRCGQCNVLIGDAMWIKREVLDAIGVLDVRFRGFLGDVDFGVRARRAGFKLMLAEGAWLHHVGAGYVKSALAAGTIDARRLEHSSCSDMAEPVRMFREKWNAALPAEFPRGGWDALEALTTLPPRTSDFEPPRTDTVQLGEWL